jgi:hypothetical protein
MSGHAEFTEGLMTYFVRGISAEVSPIRNIHDRNTEFYLLVIMDEDAIDPATQRPKVLYTCTYSDPLDATEAAVVWADSYLRKRDNRASHSQAA